VDVEGRGCDRGRALERSASYSAHNSQHMDPILV